MGGATGSGDPASALEGIRAAVADGNPDLYRHLALYLQVLRGVLLERVEQACFHLATQVYARRYLDLPRGKRLLWHRLLNERVNRCSSLLTVEQLAALARRMERESRQKQQLRQRERLQQLLRQAEEASTTGGEAPDGDADAPSVSSLPPGSVHLDLAPPLDPRILGWPQPLSPPDIDEGRDSLEHSYEDQDDDLFQPSGMEEADNAAALEALFREGQGSHTGAEEETPDQPPGEDDGWDDEEGAGPPTSRDERQDAATASLMAALMEGLLRTEAAASVPPEPEDEAGTGEPSSLEATTALFHLSAAATANGPGIRADGATGAGNQAPEPPSPWDQPGLPSDPLQLLPWLEGLERALARRLRNLSHAINVDLLRLGLSRGLLPLSLLEAVLQGQIETQGSPANVVRLQLPFGLRPGAPPLQAVAILLRSVDLEMEEPRLRTCRRRIHQHRQQVRKMAQSYRRLQRRLQAHEAERLWLQDIRASRTPGD